jgi:hypothetical protein
MIGLQLIAEMNIGGAQKKQSDAKGEIKQVKHGCLLEESHSNDAQWDISLRYGFLGLAIRNS